MPDRTFVIIQYPDAQFNMEFNSNNEEYDFYITNNGNVISDMCHSEEQAWLSARTIIENGIK